MQQLSWRIRAWFDDLEFNLSASIQLTVNSVIKLATYWFVFGCQYQDALTQFRQILVTYWQTHNGIVIKSHKDNGIKFQWDRQLSNQTNVFQDAARSSDKDECQDSPCDTEAKCKDAKCCWTEDRPEGKPKCTRCESSLSDISENYLLTSKHGKSSRL